MNHQSQQKFFFHIFSAFYNIFQQTWPSSGNTAVYGIHGRRLAT